MCVLRRDLSEELIEALNAAPFWLQIAKDPDLHPAIRDQAVTVYYRGAALLRNIRLEDDSLRSEVHFKYVPICRPSSQTYVSQRMVDDSLELADALQPLPLGLGDPETLGDYKSEMAAIHDSSESNIVHHLCGWQDRTGEQRNWIVDQESSFQLPNEHHPDRIDLLHYDTSLECFAFVEVKSIKDSRLVAPPGEVPEVVHQMANYRNRIEQHRQAILAASNNMVALKRAIGLEDRVTSVPEHMTKLLRKAVLVIGEVPNRDVGPILRGEGAWGELLAGLEKEAAGLIVCGRQGGDLNLRGRRNREEFDVEA
jgi:hypothetical protein